MGWGEKTVYMENCHELNLQQETEIVPSWTGTEPTKKQSPLHTHTHRQKHSTPPPDPRGHQQFSAIGKRFLRYGNLLLGTWTKGIIPNIQHHNPRILYLEHLNRRQEIIGHLQELESLSGTISVTPLNLANNFIGRGHFGSHSP